MGIMLATLAVFTLLPGCASRGPSAATPRTYNIELPPVELSYPNPSLSPGQ